ncbi:hypothetical protein [Bacillus dakarensis]|uniref:hypothetical protein n=1 Tax=Robertmurraya dakarensis TaxID=1926278 RepID=UPI0009809454|nr:hypothetical protein [Bacillus dakarensis]
MEDENGSQVVDSKYLDHIFNHILEPPPIVYAQYDQLWTAKIISGSLSVCVLMLLLFSGLLRSQKATGKRRRFHYKMAFIFFGLIAAHVIL